MQLHNLLPRPPGRWELQRQQLVQRARWQLDRMVLLVRRRAALPDRCDLKSAQAREHEVDIRRELELLRSELRQPRRPSRTPRQLDLWGAR